VSAQTYITLTMLAILEYLSFQLLYDHVANGLIHVAILQSGCNAPDNFSAVFDGARKVETTSTQALKSPKGSLATIIICLQDAHFRRGSFRRCWGECNKRAQIEKNRIFFLDDPMGLQKPHKA
jgi:hypothetical protein